MKKIKFGVISILSFLASFIILFLVTPNVKYYITNFMIGVSCFCCCVSFVASILAFIKNKVFQIILGAISIPFTLILLLFCYVAFEENYLELNRYDTENYFFEKNKRVYYSLGEGYFDYWFENGVLNYNTIMGGGGGPGPYYDYLFPNKHEPLLNLEKFLDYYGYEYTIDEKKQKTIIHLDDEDINLYWGARTVSYSESGKKIELNSPIIHRNCHDAYSWTSDSRLYTFISVSFLNEAGFLKNGQSKEVSRAKNKKLSDNTVFDEIKNGNLNAVQQLVNEGFDINYKDDNNQTLLCYAVENNQEEIVQFLLDCHADVEIQSNYGTPLVHATQKNNLSLVKLLVEYGADVNNVKNYSCSAILEAIIHNNFEMVDFLLSNGADINLGTFLEGEGAAIILITDMSATVKSGTKDGDLKMLDYILSKGFNPNQECYYGNAMSVAVQDGNIEAIKILLKYNAEINNYVDGIGMSVKELVEKSDNEELKSFVFK